MEKAKGRHLRGLYLFFLMFSATFLITSTECFGRDSTDAKNPLEKILTDVEEAPKSSLVETIMNLDVYSYFDVEESGETPLQRKKFRQKYETSQDYKDKLQQLKELKKDLLNKTYYLALSPAKNDLVYGDNGFRITIRERGIISECNKGKTEIEGYTFSSLPIEVKDTGYYTGLTFHRLGCNEMLTLKMSEGQALKVETNRENVEFYLIFKIPAKSSNYTVVTNVRLIVANKSDGAIYFDKTFPRK